MRVQQADAAHYYGDIDPEGIRIPLKFNRLNADVQLIAARTLYEALLLHGKRQGPVNRVFDDVTMVKQWLPEQADTIEKLWDGRCRMAQEGLGLEQLLASGSEAGA